MAKQGRSDREVYRPKVEPKAHADSEARVSQMGISTAFQKGPLTTGKGYEAPRDRKVETHSKGSQGRH